MAVAVSPADLAHFQEHRATNTHTGLLNVMADSQEISLVIY